jgi:hypothetical protein
MAPNFLSPPTITCRVFFRDPFCLPLFRRFRFSDFAFLFFGIFSEGAARCVRFHLRTMPTRQSLSQWFQLCDTIFPVFWSHVTTEGRCPSGEGQAMTDMQESLDKLRADAAEFSMMSVLTTDAQQRKHFARLADHLNVLASEIARAIAEKVGDSTPHG